LIVSIVASPRMSSTSGFQEDEMHAFKTLRHFPELSHSLRSLHEQKETKGRGFKPALAPIERQIQLKSTHGLERLTGSVIGEVSALNQFRKTLLADRAIIKETLLAASITGNATRVIPTQKVLSPLASAQEKLRIASVSFQGGGSTLNEFRGFKSLPKPEFLDQLRRSLKIQLSRDEQDALCEFLASRAKNPKASADNVECVAFIRYFLKVGEEGKADIRSREKALEEAHRLRLLKEEQAFVEKNMGESVTHSSVSSGGGNSLAENFSPHEHVDGQSGGHSDGHAGEPGGLFSPGQHIQELTIEEDAEYHSVDVSTVLDKLSVTAVNWDNSSFIESVCTSGFESYLTPAEFRMQIAKSFGIKLSEPEVLALMNKYTVQKEAPPSQPNRPSNDLIDDGSFIIPRSYNKPPPSTSRRQKHSGKGSTGGGRTPQRNFSVAAFSPHGGQNSGAMSSARRGPSSVFTNAMGFHVDMYGSSHIDDYCIDGHKFLKDFLSGTSIRKPEEARQKQQRAVYQRRRDEVNRMGQNVDCLPKVLGR
jgi:hypothetical protein